MIRWDRADVRLPQSLELVGIVDGELFRDDQFYEAHSSQRIHKRIVRAEVGGSDLDFGSVGKLIQKFVADTLAVKVHEISTMYAGPVAQR